MYSQKLHGISQGWEATMIAIAMAARPHALLCKTVIQFISHTYSSPTQHHTAHHTASNSLLLHPGLHIAIFLLAKLTNVCIFFCLYRRKLCWNPLAQLVVLCALGHQAKVHVEPSLCPSSVHSISQEISTAFWAPSQYTRAHLGCVAPLGRPRSVLKNNVDYNFLCRNDGQTLKAKVNNLHF